MYFISEYPVVIKRQATCKSRDKVLAKDLTTANECASRCHQTYGCHFFIFEKPVRGGKCIWEKTTARDCPEGWVQDSYASFYDFYELKGIFRFIVKPLTRDKYSRLIRMIVIQIN